MYNESRLETEGETEMTKKIVICKKCDEPIDPENGNWQELFGGGYQHKACPSAKCPRCHQVFGDYETIAVIQNRAGDEFNVQAYQLDVANDMSWAEIREQS